MRTRHTQVIGRQNAAAKGDCVEANPRLVMAVVAIGMIVGALLAPSAKTDAPSLFSTHLNAKR